MRHSPQTEKSNQDSANYSNTRTQYKLNSTHHPHGVLIPPCGVRSLTCLAWPPPFETIDMKPCCNPIFIRVDERGRPTTVSLKPCQPETRRYNQTAAKETASVNKNIATNASIYVLL